MKRSHLVSAAAILTVVGTASAALAASMSSGGGAVRSGTSGVTRNGTPGQEATRNAAPATGRSGGSIARGSAGGGNAAGASRRFWSGTDSWPVPVAGRGPYGEPRIGGTYGGYIGMAGSWERWLGCHGSFLAWSPANSRQANANLSRYGRGIGTGVYWFMGGPGVDPNYTGTAREAYTWGARQAARALADIATEHVTYPVVFMDVELPGISPAPDNGWNQVYTSSCSGHVKAGHIAAGIDRSDFNGFYDYLTSHSSRVPGVYSAPGIWQSIFGTGSQAAIPHVDEWTYEPETSRLSLAPPGWCLKGTSQCASFFGGVTRHSKQALMWQWSGGGGVANGVGDFDLINASGAR